MASTVPLLAIFTVVRSQMMQSWAIEFIWIEAFVIFALVVKRAAFSVRVSITSIASIASYPTVPTAMVDKHAVVAVAA